MSKPNKSLVINHSAIKLNWVHSLAVALIGVTLAVVPFYATRYVFAGLMFQKAMLFYILVTTLLLVYLWLIYKDSRYLPKFSLVGWFFLLLILGLTISTVTSQQPYLSFWGSFNRMEGLISWIYYFAFFVVITGVLRKPADWWQAIRFALVGVALVVIYALGQILRIRPFVPSADALRVESTLGNPVFLGGYLASAVPLMLAWVLSLRSSFWVRWGWVFYGLTALVLILTLSRGAWIGALVAVPIALSIYFYRYRPKWVKSVLIAAGVGAGLFVLFTLVWLVSPSGSLVKQVGKKAIFRSESMIYRQRSWTNGLKAFAEKPLLGWGLENFHIAFDKNYKALPQPTFGFTESHVDRAHNEYIGVAVAGGLVALLPYLLLLGYALYRGWRYARLQEQSDSYLINLGLLGAMVGYAVFVFTAFNLITNILFLIFGLAWMNQISTSPDSPSARRAYRPVLVILALVTLSGAYFTIVSPIWAVRLADRGTVEFRHSSNFNKSLTLFQKALAKRSFMSNVIRSQMSVISAAEPVVLAMDHPDITKFQAYTGEILRQNFITEPYTSYNTMIVAMFYGSLAKKSPDYINIMDQVFQKTIDLTPTKGEGWFRWGEAYAKLGDWPHAKEKFEQAMTIDPYSYDIKFTSGVWYLTFGEIGRGDELIKSALQAGHRAGFVEVKQIGDALLKSNQFDRAEKLYQQIIDDPQNDQETVYAITELVDVYRAAGRLSDARALASELRGYNVDENQLNQLLSELGV
ncbi:O-antigen ligase family protein [Patescibacteria group bacterium]|nr:O-antigen ligase family protein [Patescibacteria group bacterium]